MFQVKNNNNILLINPWIYDFTAYDLWSKPLGLLYIANLLRKNNYQVYYIDCLDNAHPKMKEISYLKLPKSKDFGHSPFYKENIPKPSLLKEIPRRYNRYGITSNIFKEDLVNIPKPKAVLVTSLMTYWYPGVFEAIKIIKDIYPRIPVILGGIYATLCYEHAKTFSGADYVIRGEGEIKILNLLNQITGHQPTYLPNPDDLDSLPYPAFDLIRKPKYICLLTSKGCPLRCPYCASFRLASSFRQRNAIRVVEEIEYWQENLEVEDIAFYDDALLIDHKKFIEPMLKEIIRRKIKCRFHTPNGLHIKEITERVANLMYDSGFKTIRLGLETANKEKQRRMGGKTTNKDFMQSIQNLKAAGFSGRDIGVYILTGLPNQKAQEVEDSINFVLECGAQPYLAYYSPIPGTALWSEAIKNSKFQLSSDPLFHNKSIFPCQSTEFTSETLDNLKILTKG